MSRRAGAVLALLGAAGCAGSSPPSPPVPRAAPDTAAVAAPPPANVLPPTPPRRYASVRLAFVGDINLGTLTLPGGVPPDSGRRLLDGARGALAGDLIVGNFEGVLADSGTTYKCGKAGRHVGTPPADTVASDRVGGKAVADDSSASRRLAARSSAQRRPVASSRTKRLGADRLTATRNGGHSVAESRRGADSVHLTRHRTSSKHERQPPHVACYAFLTPVALAPRLPEAGLTHLNLANNHANDFGPGGRASTESVLQGLGLKLYGPLGSIAIDTVHQGEGYTTVGLVGFTTYPFAYDLLDIERSRAVIDSLRPLVDLLIATFHGGAEGAGAVHTPEAAESLGSEPRGELRRWARVVIDAGADAVIGHGPHVLRGIEFYRGSPIVYSLGNFITYRGFNLDGPLGVTGVLWLEFDSDRSLRHARLIPMRQQPGTGPLPDPSGAALDLVRRLSEEDFGPTAARVAADGSILPPAR